MESSFMKKLNPAQLDAVSAKARALQILAGPGSGKTRVLTSRVAWLVLEKQIDPRQIVVVTFTNKAAREMKTRLESNDLLGRDLSEQLLMGTFHSICARILRQHAGLINVKNNFTIADPDLSKHTIRKLIKELPELSAFAKQKMKADAFYNEFSSSKNKGVEVDDYLNANRGDFKKRDYCIMFPAYEKRMKEDNLVDFDNLLLYGRELLKRFPHLFKSYSHVLVDEFQDTNVVQYDIVKYMTGQDKGLTIVGDPDQSIFGWRSADRENFLKMKIDFPETVVKNLEENYRSTKSILSAAFHVINIDTERIAKSLFTGNADGVPISLLRMTTDTLEAHSVADEVKRVIEYSGGLINYKDIAILVRMNFMTRSIEQALNALGIPYIVVGGVKFFERTEVKDILAYLRFFYNPNDTEAFERIIHKPRRGVGEVTLNKMQQLSRKNDWNVIKVLRALTSNQPSAEVNMTVSAKVKQNLREFLGLFDDIRAMMKDKAPVSEMLQYIIDAIEYEKYLTSQHPDKDGESRWGNVGELITFAKSAFDPPKESGAAAKLDDDRGHTLEDRYSSGFLANQDRVSAFLEATTLVGNTKEHDEADKGKVTITTMHSAKGLEWPCVFVMGCESGIMPHPRANEMEECRLLYVAMTRAKAFLYCTHALERYSWGNLNQVNLSTFLEKLPEDAYVHKTPDWNKESRTWVSQVLRIEAPVANDLKDSPGAKVWAIKE
ncbi:P-loop containing nucleoside triphosphate hydrolase protein [Lichtheimia hyalospora FSU 10163]|nr:P-loop containing nucleoside triphosphate hydrolase protein [Lichtheimia hyalospora FSU 10163]